jgi:hypothetical protein
VGERLLVRHFRWLSIAKGITYTAHWSLWWQRLVPIWIFRLVSWKYIVIYWVLLVFFYWFKFRKSNARLSRCNLLHWRNQLRRRVINIVFIHVFQAIAENMLHFALLNNLIRLGVKYVRQFGRYRSCLSVWWLMWWVHYGFMSSCLYAAHNLVNFVLQVISSFTHFH